jgi:hypothetical protein
MKLSQLHTCFSYHQFAQGLEFANSRDHTSESLYGALDQWRSMTNLPQWFLLRLGTGAPLATMASKSMPTLLVPKNASC